MTLRTHAPVIDELGGPARVDPDERIADGRAAVRRGEGIGGGPQMEFTTNDAGTNAGLVSAKSPRARRRPLTHRHRTCPDSLVRRVATDGRKKVPVAPGSHLRSARAGGRHRRDAPSGCSPVGSRLARPSEGCEVHVGLRAKLIGVSVALALSLTVVAVVAARSTTSATSGARAVESEFAERVATDQALADASDDVRRVSAWLTSGRTGQTTAAEAEVAESGRRLATDFPRAAYRGNGVKPSERVTVQRLTAAYRTYIAVRRQALRLANAGAVGVRLERAFSPLERLLTDYAATHYEEGKAGLAALRRTSRIRTEALTVAVIVALLCLAVVG